MGLLVSHRAGLRSDVSLEDYKAALRVSMGNAIESHARRMSRKMYWETLRRVSNGADRVIATDVLTLTGLAGVYGVRPALRPYAVDCFRQLVANRRLEGHFEL